MNVRRLALSRGMFAVVDAEDYARVKDFKWSAVQAESGLFYAARWVKRRQIYLHRFITDAADGARIDHRDGDGLNCRKENLRVATAAQNMANKVRPKNGKNRFRGVLKNHGKWSACIVANCVRYNLGYFDTEEWAAMAYDAKAREVHGEFARLNFPQRETPAELARLVASKSGTPHANRKTTTFSTAIGDSL